MDKKKEILFLLNRFDIDTPRTIRGRNIIEALKYDFNWTILTYDYDGDKKEIENIKIHRKSLNRFLKNVFTPELGSEKNSWLLNTIYRLFRYVLGKVCEPDPKHILNSSLARFANKSISAPDVILASIYPFSSATLGKVLVKKYFPKSKLIFDIGDPYSNNSGFSVNPRRAKKFEEKILQYADEIVVTNGETKDYYLNEFNISSDKLHIIPQGVNDLYFTQNLKSKNKQSQQIELIYAGMLYPKLRDPSALIEVLKLPQFRSTLKLNLYGSNISSFLDRDHQNIIDNNRISNIELIQKYRNADVLLYVDNAYGIQTSGKIYELISLKKPILFIYDNPNSSVYKDFRDYSNIIFCMNKNSEIQNALDNLSSSISEMKIEDYDVQQFSWKERAKKFKEIF